MSIDYTAYKNCTL